ncbi:probable acyl-[acyl-carrier-protein]--UDP-N-acetylglucosamine O-acyltransferase, mitochondrial isoform X4 [Magnolia sinica]|uniref:probable acyl-[acyl-carrier-protein]--UDP-N-acetylglucosamine O-acyltransferase, mitochondrial isoform X4 n=1 Tax=Magnolia sinica TaxID=86752 RepID=UPI00265AD2E7|nr:probable acyl-[acyl-carrier-protein]--UDP-N-acetylglucosamine O-acyltransferase, mitochondrial isoform X4 [Magnolia sinica]
MLRTGAEPEPHTNQNRTAFTPPRLSKRVQFSGSWSLERAKAGGCWLLGKHERLLVVGGRLREMVEKGENNCWPEFQLPGVSIGPFCTVGPSAKLGNSCQLHPGCHVFGDIELGDNCILLTGAIVGADLPGFTIIGSNNIIGHHAVVGVKCQDLKYKDYTHTAGATVVHQFCHLGSFSFIGGGSVVAQDVPRYLMVSGDRAELRGLNLEGLRRHGFLNTEVKSMRRAYQKIFMPIDAQTGGIEDRLAEVVQNEELSNLPVVHSMVQSIRDSFDKNRRGICKFRHWSGS